MGPTVPVSYVHFLCFSKENEPAAKRQRKGTFLHLSRLPWDTLRSSKLPGIRKLTSLKQSNFFFGVVGGQATLAHMNHGILAAQNGLFRPNIVVLCIKRALFKSTMDREHCSGKEEYHRIIKDKLGMLAKGRKILEIEE